MTRPDNPSAQARALVPAVLREADAQCVQAFGRAAYPPGTLVMSSPAGPAGTVLGPWRAGPGVMLAVDYGGPVPVHQWPEEVTPQKGPGEPRPPRLYRAPGGGRVFWHGGFEWRVRRHAPGAAAWDVVRRMPGGTPLDARCYALRQVGGRAADAFDAAWAALEAARLVVPDPYSREGAPGQGRG